MLAAKYRIPMDKIPQIMRKGKRVHGELMTLVIWKEALPFPQFTIIISNKTEPKAVGRNRIKRRMRAVLFELMKSGEFGSSNYIFHIKNPAVKDLPIDDLRQQVLTLLTQIEVRRDKDASPN